MMVRSMGLVQQAAYALTASEFSATPKIVPGDGLNATSVPVSAVTSSAWTGQTARGPHPVLIEPATQTVARPKPQRVATPTTHLPAHLVAVLNRYQVGPSS